MMLATLTAIHAKQNTSGYSWEFNRAILCYFIAIIFEVARSVSTYYGNEASKFSNASQSQPEVYSLVLVAAVGLETVAISCIVSFLVSVKIFDVKPPKLQNDRLSSTNEPRLKKLSSKVTEPGRVALEWSMANGMVNASTMDTATDSTDTAVKLQPDPKRPTSIVWSRSSRRESNFAGGIIPVEYKTASVRDSRSIVWSRSSRESQVARQSIDKHQQSNQDEMVDRDVVFGENENNDNHAVNYSGNHQENQEDFDMLDTQQKNVVDPNEYDQDQYDREYAQMISQQQLGLTKATPKKHGFLAKIMGKKHEQHQEIAKPENKIKQEDEKSFRMNASGAYGIDTPDNNQNNSTVGNTASTLKGPSSRKLNRGNEFGDLQQSRSFKDLGKLTGSPMIKSSSKITHVVQEPPIGVQLEKSNSFKDLVKLMGTPGLVKSESSKKIAGAVRVII